MRAQALFAHCFTCSKEGAAARRIARALCGAGFQVLRFDFAGLGESDGAFADTTFTTNVQDIAAAAAFMAEESAAPQLLIGHSLGGAAAIVAAAEAPMIRAVATIGAPAASKHVVEHFRDQVEAIESDGAAEVSLAGRPFVIGRAFLRDLDGDRVLAAAAALRKPLLILHAPRDATVGVENAQAIFFAARHPKSFVSLDTADHLLTRAADAGYAAAVIAVWATRYVDASEPSDDAAA